MNRKIGKVFWIIATCLIGGPAIAMPMHLPHSMAPAYIPVSQGNNFASFTPNYRFSQPQRYQQVNSGNSQPARGRVAPQRRFAPWPFPVSYAPQRSHAVVNNYPAPYGPYSSSSYRPPMNRTAPPRQQQMRYQPYNPMAALPYPSGRGINMAYQPRRVDSGRYGYPQNTLPRQQQIPASRYRQQQVPGPRYRQQPPVYNGQGRYAASGYRFRPMQQSRRYLPGYAAQQRGFRNPSAGYNDYRARRPVSGGQQAFAPRYQAQYRFRPDPRLSGRMLPSPNVRATRGSGHSYWNANSQYGNYRFAPTQYRGWGQQNAYQNQWVNHQQQTTRERVAYR